MINLGKVQEWENIEKTKISSFPSAPQVSQSTDDAKRSLEQSSSLGMTNDCRKNFSPPPTF